MNLVKLGRSGLRVSPVCLGTMTFGNKDWGCDEAESARILNSYLEQGHNFIDTADVYAGGESESILGRQLGARRQDIVLATKAFWVVEQGPNHCGSSRKHIIEACEASLRRLQTDYIDLHYVHIWDPLTPLEETLAALHTLVESGKVRYLGASDYTGWQISEAMNLSKQQGWHRFIVHQVEYSCLTRDIELEIVPASLYNGLGIIGWSPLAGGMLTGKYGDGRNANPQGRFGAGDSGKWWQDRWAQEANYQATNEFLRIANELHVSPVTLAIAYALLPEWMTSVIIGARKIEQLEANLAGGDFVIPEEYRVRLDALRPPPRIFPLDMQARAFELRNS
ncbi:aldo/keto reductase [bacterium]|nr:aldo/keto reductase [bacterium]MBU1638126.1 aldo/keto reductase [bacterium]